MDTCRIFMLRSEVTCVLSIGNQIHANTSIGGVLLLRDAGRHEMGGHEARRNYADTLSTFTSVTFGDLVGSRLAFLPGHTTQRKHMMRVSTYLHAVHAIVFSTLKIGLRSGPYNANLQIIHTVSFFCGVSHQLIA